MTIQEFAQRLNGREYGDEHTDAEEKEAKECGFIIAYGYSDDNVEFRGVLTDEVGAYDGTTISITAGATIAADDDDEEGEWRRTFLKRGWTPPPSEDVVLKIKAEWSPSDVDASWRITSNAPFAPFTVMEDGNVFCIGAVIDFNAALNAPRS